MTIRRKIMAASIMTTAFCSVPSNAIDVCHVANAGFLIKGNDTSILIDGLLAEDQYDGRFALPSNDAYMQMQKLNGPYEKLSVVISTHRHGDHFDPRATIMHMRANPRVTYIVPENTRTVLQETGLTSDEESRVIFVPDGQQAQYVVNGANIEAFDIDHGEGQPQNTGYRVTVDDISVFHTGDINTSRAQLSDSGLNALPVEVLLVPFWFGLSDETQRAALEQSWSYQTIIPTHFPAKPAPWMAQYGGFEGLKETATAAYDKGLILAEEGACKSFTP